eukprot:TRINITY_DN30052_c0_g1_i1.p1 TRINITY_DN30052_c0_g1~~TRINITY_DN30052_c0_g1_i1.p1  ORF type:complete len:299 (-),score=37.94 TRINITY_DN30052_c0_g1_i1:181-1077(-)
MKARSARWWCRCAERLTNDQRKLACLLGLLTSLAAFEYLYGFWCLDVKAVADSIQSTLHIGSVFVALAATGLAAQAKDEAFAYGYERVETLAAFTNCSFAIFEITFSCVHHVLHDAVMVSLGGDTVHGSSAKNGIDLFEEINIMRCVFNCVGLIVFFRELRATLRRSLCHRGALLPSHSELMASVILKVLSNLATTSLCLLASKPSLVSVGRLVGLPPELPLAVTFTSVLLYLVWPPLAAAARILLLALPEEVVPSLDASYKDVLAVPGRLYSKRDRTLGVLACHRRTISGWYCSRAH